MRHQPNALTLAVATALGTLAALPAQAILVTGNTTTFAGTASVTDACGPVNATACLTGPTSAAPQTLASPSLNQFASSTGVLIGTTITLGSTRTQTISGSLANGIATTTKVEGKKTFNVPGSSTTGTGSSNAQLAAPGVSQSLGTITRTGSATVPISSSTASFGPSSAGTATNTSVVVGDSDLNSYVGGGTVTVNLTAPTVLRADSTFTNGTKNKTRSSATYKLDWSGKLSVEYQYLLHAAPSFDGSSELLSLDLDFGTLSRGEDAVAQNFSIFNLFATDRIGLDLDSFTPAGDSAAFTTNLATFLALAAGGGNSFYFDFVTSAIGDFSASYSFVFSDADLGAASSRFSYGPGFVINLRGSVRERVDTGGDSPSAPVPVPGVLALLVSGLLGLRISWRRGR